MFRLFLALISLFVVLSEPNSCLNVQYARYLEEDYMRLDDFNRLDELKFNCSKPLELSIFEIKPNKKLILTNDLNTIGLKIRPVRDSVSISFYNFKGFDLMANPFSNENFIDYTTEYIQWNICSSNLDFYLSNQLLGCNISLIDKKWFSSMFMQSNLLNIRVCKLSRLCPIVFRNSYLILFKIDRIANSFLNKNVLSFEPLEIVKLNSTIIKFETQLYRVDLDSNLLHEKVFKNLVVLDISGQVGSIEETLFKKLTNLRIIRFSSEKVRSLFSHNNKWMKYLNQYVTKHDSVENAFLSLIIYQAFKNYSIYTYPNEDFCLFKTLPHDRFVLPKLKPNFRTSCSCTELYLIQHSYKFSSNINYYTQNILSSYYFAQYYSDIIDSDGIFSHCVNKSIDKFIAKCDFSQRLRKCNITFNSTDEKNFYLNDWYELSRNSQIIFSVYLNSFLSLIVILFNMITIKILNNINSTNNTTRMYQHLKANHYLHLFYLMSHLFKLMMECKFIDLFCSAIYESFYTQVFNVFVVKFLGNTLKTASNISHIAFTLSRYVVIVNDSKSISYRLVGMNFKAYLIILFTISLFINVNTCFEYTFETKTTYFKLSSKSNNLVYKKQSPVDDFVEDFSISKYSALQTIRYIKILFSDFLYIAASFLLDLVLLRFVKNKRKIVINCKSNTLKQKENFNSRLTVMIVLNGINFSLFRLPSSILSLYGFIYRFDENNFEYKPNVVGYIVCRLFFFCSCLEEYFYFIYLNSFVVQFFIFIKFDNNFNSSFQKLKKDFFEKIYKRFL